MFDSTLIHLKSILLWKREKVRTYHSSGTITQKSIQWFRLSVNDPVSVQPKHYIEIKKKVLEHWTKLSKTHHLTRTSWYNQYERCERLSRQTDRNSHRCNRAALMRLSMMTKQKHFGLLICHDFHCLLCSSYKHEVHSYVELLLA